MARVDSRLEAGLVYLEIGHMTEFRILREMRMYT